MNPFTVGIFTKPRFSAFPWSHGNRISMDAGKLHVIGSEYLDTGEAFDLNSLGNVTRVAPMLAPTLDTYKTDVFAFAVRLRTIGMASRNPWIYEDFFNLNENVDGSKTLPMIPLPLLIGKNRCKNNTLLENFGLPTYKSLSESYLEFLRNSCNWVFDPVVIGNTVYGDVDLDTPNEVAFRPSSYVEHGLRFSTLFDYNGNSYYYYFEGYEFPYTKSLFVYLLERYDSLREYLYTFIHRVEDVDEYQYTPDYFYFSDSGARTIALKDEFSPFNVLDWLYEHEKVDSVTLLNEYTDYLLDELWSLSTTGYTEPVNGDALYGLGQFLHLHQSSLGYQILDDLQYQFPDLPTQDILFLSHNNGTSEIMTCPLIPVYFFDSYFKIYTDWFINTAITDPDIYYQLSVRVFHPEFVSSSVLVNEWAKLFSGAVGTMSTGALGDYMRAWNNFDNTRGFEYRYWSNDYFTSCFPSPQAGQAVGIPIDGTIVDLRNANAMQKLKERLLYAGRRFRDVLYALTGKRTSSAIMDMSEVLGAWSNNINVDSVLQQSASENGQPLANYAGTGLGYRSGGKGAYYLAEEPTVIIFVACVKPRASYFQGLHRKFMRSNVYDYDIAQLANVGEEIVRRGELYLDGDSDAAKDPDNTIFGYQRRNGSFMWCPDEVHGDFRGSLDYWHNARIFGSQPTLSRAFLEIRPDEDNLNRIFAVTSDSVNHFYAHFTFDGNVIRHLPKHVHYDL